MGIGPEALYQMTRTEYKSEPDKIAVKDPIRLLNEYFLPKRNSYHNRGEFFWTKQTETETPEEFFHSKELQLKIYFFKFYDRNYGYKTTRQTNERKET